MNCKQGDLAIVVKSSCGNEGKIVRCMKLLGRKGWLQIDGSVVFDYSWEIDTTLHGWRGDASNSIRDGLLRPINNPGDDEVDEISVRRVIPEGEIA